MNLSNGGPGLTGDRNFQNSVEYYEKGSGFRRIAYGKTREEVLFEVGTSDPRMDWEDHWVIMPTKRIRMGLSPAWARVTRRFNAYGDLE
jgi:hypothetical protein